MVAQWRHNGGKASEEGNGYIVSMPTLADWLALERSEETPYLVRLFERRPEWLATGRIEEEILVWFDSEIPDRPLYLEYEELTLCWDWAHEHILWTREHEPVDKVVDLVIEMIESVLSGTLMQVLATTTEGRWQRAGFASEQERVRLRAEFESEGLIVTFTRWPGRKVQ